MSTEDIFWGVILFFLLIVEGLLGWYVVVTPLNGIVASLIMFSPSIFLLLGYVLFKYTKS